MPTIFVIESSLRRAGRSLCRTGSGQGCTKQRVPKFKLLPEHERRLRLDDEAEQKLLVAARACNWKPSTFELFRHVIILARDTGMRNRRELYRIRVENLDWNNRIIFVPDSKTADGRRMIPMSDRVG